jgi:hypothetical protein
LAAYCSASLGTVPSVTHFDLAEQLAELDSEEASDFGVTVRPMTLAERAALVLTYVRLT